MRRCSRRATLAYRGADPGIFRICATRSPVIASIASAMHNPVVQERTCWSSLTLIRLRRRGTPKTGLFRPRLPTRCHSHKEHTIRPCEELASVHQRDCATYPQQVCDKHAAALLKAISRKKRTHTLLSGSSAGWRACTHAPPCSWFRPRPHPKVPAYARTSFVGPSTHAAGSLRSDAAACASSPSSALYAARGALSVLGTTAAQLQRRLSVASFPSRNMRRHRE